MFQNCCSIRLNLLAEKFMLETTQAPDTKKQHSNEQGRYHIYDFKNIINKTELAILGRKILGLKINKNHNLNNKNLQQYLFHKHP